jgi:hypothetical protein
MAQQPLYGNYLGLRHHIRECFVASLGDVLILAGLFGFMAAAAASWRWVEWGRARWLALAAGGTTIAAAIEYRALYVGKWSYAESMPLIPGLDLGVSPIAQMVIGPIALAFVSRRQAARSLKNPRSEGGEPC